MSDISRTIRISIFRADMTHKMARTFYSRLRYAITAKNSQIQLHFCLFSSILFRDTRIRPKFLMPVNISRYFI
jgi:hypothetical protein